MGWLSDCVPDEVVRSVTAIDLDALAARGIEGLIIDVDNTLLAHGVREMDTERREWARQAVGRFRVCLLSNSVRGRRARRLSQLLGCPGVSVWDWRRKPFGGGFRRATAITGTAPEHTAMIGDQLLTDVLAGNRCGLYTIWVERISPREFIGTRANRIIEGWCARRLRRAGMLPPHGQDDETRQV